MNGNWASKYSDRAKSQTSQRGNPFRLWIVAPWLNSARVSEFSHPRRRSVDAGTRKNLFKARTRCCFDSNLPHHLLLVQLFPIRWHSGRRTLEFQSDLLPCYPLRAGQSYQWREQVTRTQHWSDLHWPVWLWQCGLLLAPDCTGLPENCIWGNCFL